MYNCQNLAECTILPKDVSAFPLALSFNAQKWLKKLSAIVEVLG
jgi:hypothetical protein